MYMVTMPVTQLSSVLLQHRSCTDLGSPLRTESIRKSISGLVISVWRGFCDNCVLKCVPRYGQDGFGRVGTNCIREPSLLLKRPYSTHPFSVGSDSILAFLMVYPILIAQILIDKVRDRSLQQTSPSFLQKDGNNKLYLLGGYSIFRSSIRGSRT